MHSILNEPGLLNLEFKKVHFKNPANKIITYYYKRGLYLELVGQSVYIVYNKRMNVIGVISSIRELEVICVAKAFPVYLN
jgi:hypothetical protein